MPEIYCDGCGEECEALNIVISDSKYFETLVCCYPCHMIVEAHYDDIMTEMLEEFKYLVAKYDNLSQLLKK